MSNKLFLHVNELFSAPDKIVNDLFDNKDDEIMKTEFSKATKIVKRAAGVMIALWVGWIVFIAAILMGLGYVAIHFIHKFW